MKCRQAAEWMDALLDERPGVEARGGSPSSASRRPADWQVRLEAHLAGCAECHRQWRALQVAEAALRAPQPVTAPPNLLADFRQRLAAEQAVAAARPAATAHTGASWWERWVGNWWLPAGALGATAVAAGLVLTLRNPPPADTLATTKPSGPGAPFSTVVDPGRKPENSRGMVMTSPEELPDEVQPSSSGGAVPESGASPRKGDGVSPAKSTPGHPLPRVATGQPGTPVPDFQETEPDHAKRHLARQPDAEALRRRELERLNSQGEANLHFQGGLLRNGTTQQNTDARFRFGMQPDQDAQQGVKGQRDGSAYGNVRSHNLAQNALKSGNTAYYSTQQTPANNLRNQANLFAEGNGTQYQNYQFQPERLAKQVAAQQAPPAPELEVSPAVLLALRREVTLRNNVVSLQLAMEEMAEAADVELRVDPGVAPLTVTIPERNLPLWQALQSVAQQANVEIVAQNNQLLLRRVSEEAENKRAEQRSKLDVAARAYDRSAYPKRKDGLSEQVATQPYGENNQKTLVRPAPASAGSAGAGPGGQAGEPVRPAPSRPLGPAGPAGPAPAGPAAPGTPAVSRGAATLDPAKPSIVPTAPLTSQGAFGSGVNPTPAAKPTPEVKPLGVGRSTVLGKLPAPSPPAAVTPLGAALPSGPAAVKRQEPLREKREKMALVAPKPAASTSLADLKIARPNAAPKGDADGPSRGRSAKKEMKPETRVLMMRSPASRMAVAQPPAVPDRRVWPASWGFLPERGFEPPTAEEFSLGRIKRPAPRASAKPDGIAGKAKKVVPRRSRSRR